MSELKCCVVGAGNIGQHHARSIVNQFGSADLVDINRTYIEGAQYHESIIEIKSNHYDAFVISTTSKYRFSCYQTIRNFFPEALIILEKPLFFTSAEYLAFAGLRDDLAYINVPYYSHDILRFIIQNFSLGAMISYEVKGYNWGMCCNILHDISIIDCLSHFSQLAVSNCNAVLKSWKTSKRSGFYEVFGDLNLTIGEVKLNFSCAEGNEYSKIAELKFDRASITIDFGKGILSLLQNDGVAKTYDFNAPKASETTAPNIYKIISGSGVLPIATRYVPVSSMIYTQFAEKMKDVEIPKGVLPFS